MKNFAKTFYIVMILISGAALIPVLGVQGRTFRWQNYAGLYETPTPGGETLEIDHDHGVPGSFFTITGTGYSPNTPTGVIVNGVQVASNVMSNEFGEIGFQLNTSNASIGFYEVSLTINPGIFVTFNLIEDGDLHPPSGVGSIINVPPGIALIERFLPVIVR